MIKTWQERLDNQYTYPSMDVCRAMEEEIAELREALAQAKCRNQMLISRLVLAWTEKACARPGMVCD